MTRWEKFDGVGAVLAPSPFEEFDVEFDAALARRGDVHVDGWSTTGSPSPGPATVTEDVADQVRRLREIVARTEAMSVPLPDGHRPTDEQVLAMDDEAQTWWYLSVTA